MIETKILNGVLWVGIPLSEVAHMQAAASSDLASLAGRLQYARAQQKLSGRALSQAAGLADPHVSRIESDPAANPTLRTLEAIAAARGVKPEWLLCGVGEPPFKGDV